MKHMLPFQSTLHSLNKHRFSKSIIYTLKHCILSIHLCNYLDVKSVSTKGITVYTHLQLHITLYTAYFVLHRSLWATAEVKHKYVQLLCKSVPQTDLIAAVTSFVTVDMTSPGCSRFRSMTAAHI